MDKFQIVSIEPEVFAETLASKLLMKTSLTESIDGLIVNII